jgi:ABC-type proline/glycine betaine transport system permease subunit
LQAYTANHQQFLKDFLQHLLISSWPLLLVIVGTVLLWIAPPDSVSAPPRDDAELVELSVGRSTLK